MYRLRLVKENDPFDFIDVLGDQQSITELFNFIQVINEKHLYYNLVGIYTVDGTEISRTLGFRLNKASPAEQQMQGVP
jgi:hypothetical protein